MIEEEESPIRCQYRYPLKKTGSLLLLCQGSGKIVFVQGDPSVLELKHSQVLHKNLFALGFTLRSLLAAQKLHPEGLIDHFSNGVVDLHMELLSRTHLLDPPDPEEQWSQAKRRVIKGVKLTCSLLRVGFSDGRMKHRKSVIRRVYERERGGEGEELVLVQVQEERRVVRAGEEDYRHVRNLLLQQLHPQIE